MTDASSSNAPQELKLKLGDRVQVIQQIPHSQATTTSKVEGEFIRFEQKKTGSWFAHSKTGRLWLDRIVLKKDDGELVMCNLDHYSLVEKV